MVLASRLSTRVSGLGADDAKRVEALVRARGLPVAPPKLAVDRWLDLMSHDKKVQVGRDPLDPARLRSASAVVRCGRAARDDRAKFRALRRVR